MVLPSHKECTYVVNIDFCVFDTSENVFHGLLGKVWGSFESHRQHVVSVLAKGCYNGHEVFRLLIQEPFM